jgi:hypothetical protein
MYGLLAALIAAALGYAAFLSIAPGLESYEIVIGDVQSLLVEWCGVIVAAMIALGMLIGDVSARLAVRRYLK